MAELARSFLAKLKTAAQHLQPGYFRALSTASLSLALVPNPCQLRFGPLIPLAMSSASATTSPDLDVSGQDEVLRVPAKVHEAPDSNLLDRGTLWRSIDPLTTRYRASAADPLITDRERQDEVVEVIRSRLKDLLPDFSKEDNPKKAVHLGIVFDVETTGGQTFPVIDLIGSTIQVCENVRSKVRAIQVEDERNPQRIVLYPMHDTTGRPSTDVVPVDFLFPKARLSEERDLFRFLEKAAAKSGTMTGSIRIMVSLDFDASLRTFKRYGRHYIKLSAGALQLNYYDLICRPPKVLSWNGLFVLHYHDRYLRCYHDYAADHPRSCVAESRRPLSNSPPSARLGSDSTSGGAGSAQKKRKSDQ